MSDPNGAPGAMQSFGGSPAPHPSSLRPEAISSAVAFLSDPKVSNAPLSQRVSFLESKGLSPAEIDASIAQTGAAGARGMAGPTAGPGAYGPAYGPYGINPQAQQQGRDWRDWFIMAVVSGTVGYGLISLARRYLFPHLQPPNSTILESDLQALTAKYDEVAAQLTSLEDESQGIKAGLEQQKEVVEQSLKEVEEAVTLIRNGEKKRESDMDDVKREVDRIKDDMPRMFDKHREAQAASLSDVQTELKSLKSLLISRGAAAAPPSGIPTAAGRSPSGLGAGAQDSLAGTGSSTPTGAAGSSSPKTSSFQPPVKPSIPAWQLAQPGSTSNGSGSGSGSGSKETNGMLNGIDPATES